MIINVLYCMKEVTHHVVNDSGVSRCVINIGQSQAHFFHLLPVFMLSSTNHVPTPALYCFSQPAVPDLSMPMLESFWIPWIKNKWKLHWQRVRAQSLKVLLSFMCMITMCKHYTQGQMRHFKLHLHAFDGINDSPQMSTGGQSLDAESCMCNRRGGTRGGKDRLTGCDIRVGSKPGIFIFLHILLLH